MRTTPTDTVNEFMGMLERSGFRLERASGCVVTVCKPIERESNESFCEADMMCPIYALPQTQPGSTWGTDGGSIGGLSAMRSGMYRMNRSGVDRRVVKMLAKRI